MLIPVLIAVIAACVLIVIIMLTKSLRKDGDAAVTDKIQKKGKTAILKEAEKKLAHDPHNIEALTLIGDLYFGEKNWEKTWNIYKTLYDISAAHIEVNVALVTLRMGIAAFNMDKIDDAMNSLMLSLKRDPESFEGNYMLGKAFYQKDTYDKALLCLKKARSLNQENVDVIELIGLSFFKMSKYRDSLPFLKKVLDVHPEKKEILFDMAVAMSECSMQDKALKVFVHLRPDPDYGAQSCLEAGRMHEKAKNFQAAVQDYEIALKLEKVPEQLMLQIRYRLANTYIAMNDISSGLAQLKAIQSVKSAYKDVDGLVVRYTELNQNKNLQTYLLSGTSDFVALCRKFISAYYSEGYVKVEDVQVASEAVEIIASIESPKWQAKILFRFYRNQAVIGDIYIREFHGKIRDTKCDTGVCVTMGSFSESAHKFTEGRPIDLVEKDAVCKILKKINMFN